MDLVLTLGIGAVAGLLSGILMGVLSRRLFRQRVLRRIVTDRAIFEELERDPFFGREYARPEDGAAERRHRGKRQHAAA